jgi:diguanylate cyclase (GGDEF)-like protein
LPKGAAARRTTRHTDIEASEAPHEPGSPPLPAVARGLTSTHPETDSMTAAATPQASAPAHSQLSVPQMLGVMRVEFHRARSQRYPVTCLMIAVDGFEAAVAEHGPGVGQRLMRATYDCLRDKSRERAFIGMALMSGDRIMAVFPNTPAARMSQLGEELNAVARRLRVEVGGTAMPVRLSLGASHSLLEETSTFEGFVAAAGRALAMATEAGGDRYVMWREAEAELDELRLQLSEQIKAFKREHASLVEEAAEDGGLHQTAVIEEIQALFGSIQRTPDIARLEKQVLELAARELFEERQKAIHAVVSDHKRQIDLLERRLAKLTDVLGVTESELRRVMAMKSMDPGVASLYKTVQGLDSEDAMRETKQAMMAEIFESNFALQKQDRS